MNEHRSKYRERRTARFAAGERVKEFEAFRKQADKRLTILESAANGHSLLGLPSNRFHALGGDRIGQYSISINSQWRICFEWPEGDREPSNIEIVDYH